MADDVTSILLKIEAQASDLVAFTKEFAKVERVADQAENSVKALGAALSSAADLTEIKKLVSSMAALQEQSAKATQNEREASEIRRRAAQEAKTIKDNERKALIESEAATKKLTDAEKLAAKEAKRIADEARKIKPVLDEATSSGNSFGQSLKKTAGFLAALTVFKVAKDGLVSFFKETVTDGVEFNATLERAEISIGSVLRQFNPERFKTFDAALDASREMIEQLKKAALESPASFEDLLTGLQGAAGSMAAANIPIREQVGLVVRMSQALAALGVPLQEIRQETTAILTGNIDRNARAAQALGITGEEIAKQKEQGTLLEYLQQKTAAFGEAADRAQTSVSLLKERLSEAITLSASEATKELSESYRQLLRSLTDLVASDAFKQIQSALAASAKFALNVTRGVVDFVATKAPTAATGETRSGNRARALGERVAALASPEEKAALLAEIENEIKDLQAEIDDIYRANLDSNVPMSGADRDRDAYARSLLPNLVATRDMLSAGKADTKIEQTAAANSQKAADEAAIVAAEKIRKEREKASQFLDNDGAKIRERIADNERQLMQAEDRIKAIDIEIGKINEKRGLEASNAQSAEAFAVADLKAADEILPLLKERAAAEKVIAAERQKQVDLADKEAAQRLQLKSDNEQRRAAAALSGINSNRFLTERQKRAQRFQVFSEEAAALPGQIAAAQGSAAAAPEGSATAQFYTQEANRLTNRRDFGLNADLEENRQLSALEEVQAKLVEIQDGFMTVGDLVGNTLQSAIDGVSTSMSSLLLGTMTWGDALRNIGGSIINSVIGGITRMFAEWIVGRLAASAVEKTAAASDAAAKAPSALLTSISSYGVAAAVGLAAVLAAMAMFDTGGYTGGSNPKKIAGAVHEDEWVSPSWMLSDPQSGPLIAALEGFRTTGSMDSIAVASSTAAMASAGSFAPSGRSGGSSPVTGDAANNFAFFNSSADAEEWLRSKDGRGTMIDFMRQNAYEV